MKPGIAIRNFLSALALCCALPAFAATMGTNGTYVPTITFGGGATGMTVDLQNGRYTRYGSRTCFNAVARTSVKGSSTGAIAMTLPFTANAASGSFGTIAARIQTMAAGITTPVQTLISASGTTVGFEKLAAGVATSLLDTDAAAGSVFIIGGCYETSTN